MSTEKFSAYGYENSRSPERKLASKTVFRVSKEFGERALAKGMASVPTTQELANRASAGGSDPADNEFGPVEMLISIDSQNVANLALWSKFEKEVLS